MLVFGLGVVVGVVLAVGGWFVLMHFVTIQ